MNQKELKLLCYQAFTQRTLYKPVRRVPQKPKADESYHHTLYPLNEMDQLIAQLKQLKIEDGYNDKFSIRYLVTDTNKLLLAFEGHPGKNIPAHRDMRTRCLAAGNIFFSEDYTHITKINYQSGDFHPDPGSIVWVIAILLSMEASLAMPLMLELTNIHPHNDLEEELSSLPLTREMLLDLLPVDIENTVLLPNQTAAIEISEYIDPRACNRNSFFKEQSSLAIERPYKVSRVASSASSYITPPSTP